MLIVSGFIWMNGERTNVGSRVGEEVGCGMWDVGFGCGCGMRKK